MTQSVATAGIASKHNEATALVKQMTLEEKTAFASGKSFWYLESSARLDIPGIMLTDGPHGLRKQQTGGDHVGLSASVAATCFPTASALAATWNTALLTAIGIALGEQCVAEDVAVLLGPGMNIKRHPLCGRNFEYFSEDPILTGELATAMINGVQSQGVGTSVKHFAANNQEYGRMFVDAIIDPRTLREIYLRGFEMAVRQAQPWTVMCAYNRLNGTYCGENDWLLNKVLRDEWGFEGLVVTDWGATNERVDGLAAGLDLEMPGSGGMNDQRLATAVKAGELAESTLDQAIVRNVSLALCGGELKERQVELDHNAHHQLARRAATEAAVLLKNSSEILPLAATGRIGVVGAFAKKPRYQGAGSSQVVPTRLDNAFDAIKTLVGDHGEVLYTPGYEPHQSPVDDAQIQAAVDLAGQVDTVIVFAGLPGTYESEGFDREHMRMPEQHNRLITELVKVNPNLIVVLANGSPIAMPWIDQVSAVLECYLAGQAGGAAVADILFGHANPSGKLAETFPLMQTDVPSDPWFPGENRQVQYREGLYVGYRYFDSAEKPVLFPFGHGLSYTEFSYERIRVANVGEDIQVEVDLKNIGERQGAEVIQLYAHQINPSMYRPEQELKAFHKVQLDPSESQTVTLTLDRRAFAVFDPETDNWIVEAGVFQIRVGSSSRDIRLVAAVTINSSDHVSAQLAMPGARIERDGLAVDDTLFAGMLGKPVPTPEASRPYHINSTLSDIQASWLGRKVRARIEAQFRKNMGLTANPDPQIKKMFEEMLTTMPLRSFVLFGRGSIQFKQMHAVIALLNHEYLKFLSIVFGGRSGI